MLHLGLNVVFQADQKWNLALFLPKKFLICFNWSRISPCSLLGNLLTPIFWVSHWTETSIICQLSFEAKIKASEQLNAAALVAPGGSSEVLQEGLASQVSSVFG